MPGTFEWSERVDGIGEGDGALVCLRSGFSASDIYFRAFSVGR